MNESTLLTQFNDLGLAEPLLRAVSAEGYTTPTPIQAQVIPAMLAQSDIVGIAQTGTGKTASFVLPLLNDLADSNKRPEPKRAGALILVPTRELAAQVADSIRTYARFARVSTALVIGGAKPGPQIRALARGVDILIATPGRLEDHMSTGAVRLDRTTTIVLDEADQMLDLGFMPAIRRILAKLPAGRRTVLMSATMPAPIRALAADFLDSPAEIAVAPAAKPIDAIDQSVIHVQRQAKQRALVDLLRGAGVERTIVFTRTKRGADRVAAHLDRAGLAAAAIHGNKSQGQRERALAAFKKGRVNILVATDIAARGIDIDDVSHVINYELPNVPEAYVHRIGRTARAGKSGTAVSLCDGDERSLLRDIERLIGRSLIHTGEPGAPSTKSSRNGSKRNQQHRSKPRRHPAAAGGKPGPKRRTRRQSPEGTEPQRTPRQRSKPGRKRRIPAAAADAGLHRMLGA